MLKKKSLFITFEGIEGSGKSYHSKKLYKKLKKIGLSVFLTREPGGSVGAEKIRNIILTGKKNKFSITTDTLLYLAARNEHIENKLVPLIKKKKIIICDRFTDSTLAYQVYAKGVDKNLVDNIHKKILKKIKPDLTIILTVSLTKAFLRIKKRKKLNRYDKFSKAFYKKAQNAFIKIAKKNKKKYLVIDNTSDSNNVEKIIFKNFVKLLNK